MKEFKNIKVFENLIPINEAPEVIPIAEKTLRNWRAQGRYHQIFVKLGGKMFVDLQELAQIIEVQKQKSLKMAVTL